jgi:hypothetical protein
MTAQRAEVLDRAYARDRAEMVARHHRARGIENPLLLAAMGDVPRDLRAGAPPGIRLRGLGTADRGGADRHEELARLARARLKRLGYTNVEIICADGTKGLPEEAPFQAIIVSAGGPQVPEALKQQLAPQGWLIVPVGPIGYQTLMRVRRTGKDSFEEEDFGRQ